jgi:hypothetical protein
MTDLSPTIVARSDQLNADDLIGSTRTVKVTKVLLREAAEQPVAIHYEGDDGKPYLPCKSMRRVMIAVWGRDGNAFVGQRMTLYRDDRVTFGKDAVGGIRISHMSGIDRDVTLALMVTRGQRKPYTVRPLAPEQRREGGGARNTATAVDLPAILAEGAAAAARGSAPLQAWWGRLSAAEKVAAKPSLDGKFKPIAARADAGAGEEEEPSFGDMPAVQSGQAAEPLGDAGEANPTTSPPNPSAEESSTSIGQEEAGQTPRGPPPPPNSSTDGHDEPSFDVVKWGERFRNELLGMTAAKAITDAWSDAKSKGLTAKLQHHDPDLFDALVQTKDERFDEIRRAGARG